MNTSSFQAQLFGNGDTVPGPRYVVIETRYDIVVTPYTNAFLAGGENILVQDQCPTDNVGHVGMFSGRPHPAERPQRAGPERARLPGGLHRVRGAAVTRARAGEGLGLPRHGRWGQTGRHGR